MSTVKYSNWILYLLTILFKLCGFSEMKLSASFSLVHCFVLKKLVNSSNDDGAAQISLPDFPADESDESERRGKRKKPREISRVQAKPGE